MDFAEEARRPSPHPADPARFRPCTITIADLTGANVEVVFVTCHETTIGSRNTSDKSEMNPS
jgi:hypothetical protein